MRRERERQDTTAAANGHIDINSNNNLSKRKRRGDAIYAKKLGKREKRKNRLVQLKEKMHCDSTHT